ncbi:MAG: hypothetical protein NTY56_02385 [Patescibacteria group bacterium]|nr:hypothetical protein [Patescibacteria group bacterium]
MKTKRHNSSNKIIGYAMYVVAFVMPLSHLPAIINLYQTKVTTGLSIESWVVYFFGAMVAGDDSFQRLLLVNNIGKTLAGLGLIALSTAAILFGYDLINTENRSSKR